MLGFIKKLLGIIEPEWEKLKQQGALVIDFRSAAEYSRGHVKGSINIPLQSLDAKISNIKKQQKPVITCCRSGARSGAAVSKLKDYGIEAYNGGSWENVDRHYKN